MDAERHQRLVWPLLLILTGLLLLLNQLGVLSLSWYAIWHLWPLVLVLIGLDILLNHTRLGAVVFLVVSSAVILLAVALLPRLGHRASNLEDMALSHPVAGIESAEVRLQVGVGELTVSATEDAEHLYEALVTHDPSHTKIIHDVATEGDVARIRLRSEHQRSPAGGVAGDRWQVSLNAGVATHLRIDGGLNKIRLDLGGLRLSGLVVNMGVGEVQATLPSRGAYEAAFDGGVGALTLVVPTDAMVRIRVDAGLGQVTVPARYARDGSYYVSEGYERAQALGDDVIEIDIDGGIGAITIR